MPPVTPFSRAFAESLRAEMAIRKITQQAVMEETGRSRGFVSDQALGKRPVDTDVLTAVARLAGVSPRQLVEAVLARLSPPDELAARRRQPRTPPPPVKKAARKTTRPSVPPED